MGDVIIEGECEGEGEGDGRWRLSLLRLLCSSFAFGSSARVLREGLALMDNSSCQWASYIRH